LRDPGCALAYLGPTRERYRALTESEEREDLLPTGEGVIAGSDDFVRLHLATARGSGEIPRRHLRPPRPALGEILGARGDGEALVSAYECGYTMPAIAEHLGLHPSTVSRRLSRRRAQITT
jgi:hypothetical protein